MEDYRIKITLCGAQKYSEMLQCKYYKSDGCEGCYHYRYDDSDNSPLSICEYEEQEDE